MTIVHVSIHLIINGPLILVRFNDDGLFFKFQIISPTNKSINLHSPLNSADFDSQFVVPLL